jgi:hypothetical protein
METRVTGLLTLVPTRNRVENALGLLHTWYDTSTEDDSGLLFVVGTEDPRLEEYRKKIPKEHLFVFPDRGLVKALNYVAPRYVNEYESIGFMGDDHRPRNPGWDKRYLDALRASGPGYVYGNDLLMGEQLPTQVAISSSIIKALGFFGPPGFWHLYVDNTWRDMGAGLDRLIYLDDVVVEHMHPAAGKAEFDSGYKHVNSQMMVKHDQQEYKRWKRVDYPKELNRVAQALDITLPVV